MFIELHCTYTEVCVGTRLHINCNDCRSFLRQKEMRLRLVYGKQYGMGSKKREYENDKLRKGEPQKMNNVPFFFYSSSLFSRTAFFLAFDLRFYDLVQSILISCSHSSFIFNCNDV